MRRQNRRLICYSRVVAKTVPVDYIGKENLGYTLLALPSEIVKSHIAALLNDLSVELPGIIWPMPPEQLHITLCEIIQPKSYTQDKETLYKLHAEQYENVPAQILSALQKFTVTFDTIETSSQAIIVRSSDATSFNVIRAKLVANMPLPSETRTPPDIIHSSIARYSKEVELERVQEVVSRHNVAVEEEITEFKLLRNEIPPLQKYEVLKTYLLATR